MKEKEFIIAEVKKHPSASIKGSKYEVIEAAKNMPTFEGGLYCPATFPQWEERNTR